MCHCVSNNETLNTGNPITVSWTVAVISFALEFLPYGHDKGLRLSSLTL